VRNEFKAKVKVAAYERSGGVCEECGARLQPGRIHYDHAIPDALGGEPTLANCAVLCTACHGVKTARQDVPQIAKMKRQRAAHIGAKGPSRWQKPQGVRFDWKQGRYVKEARDGE
jgi:5-methylcytosine-specific restriction endonuclease McrA